MTSSTISLLLSLSLVACGDKDGTDGSSVSAAEDVDGDGFSGTEDCDDSAETGAAVYPGAAELCDGLDNDCDGYVDNGAVDASTWYMDVDRDGYGDDAGSVHACEAPEGYVDRAGDCDDADAAFNPGAEEDCTDPTDYNCDGSSGYADADGDGWAACMDCDDGAADIRPDGDELCDGVDNNCDGVIDEDSALDAATWYGDVDGDGYGTPDSTAVACEAPEGFVASPEDCDDSPDGGAAIYPGADEYCDAIDNNCDGVIDEPGAVDASTWYLDGDGDGWGSEEQLVAACEQPEGYVAEPVDGVNFDCDDGTAAAYPGAVEVCDGMDNDCNGDVDEDSAADALTWYMDGDGDGYGDADRSVSACDQPLGYVADDRDCDDGAAAINPAALEWCDGVDNDCDGDTDPGSAQDAATWFADADGDGYGDAAVTALSCELIEGFVANDEDCDDSPESGPDVHPGADEYCDDIDNNCDGSIDEDSALDAITWFFDMDRDGWGDENNAVLSCDKPSGAVAKSGDCDDSTTDASPDEYEICDGIDNDCDGEEDEGDAADADTWYMDVDGDGFGDPAAVVTACVRPLGVSANDSDCNDASAAVWPGADELCDGLDNNCDGAIDEDGALDAIAWFFDQDGDGYGDPLVTALSCEQPPDYVGNSEDCDDGSALAAPGLVEVCDGLDNNCDGVPDDGSAVDAVSWYPDSDGDGYGVLGETVLACEAPEGYAATADDCDDGSAAVSPGNDELCDGVDNDCDGFVDDADPEGAVDAVSWYVDGDGDGYGDALGTADYSSCELQVGYAGNNEDCDDSLSSVYPAALEVCDDGLDNDCDGTLNGCTLSGEWSVGDADTRFTGDGADQYAGYAVASAGDVDGDGDEDFLVGAYGNDQGAAYLFLDVPAGDVGPGDADAVLWGEASSDFAGFSLAGAGDVDGDGYGDFLVGAYGSDAAASNAGAAYLVRGPISGEVSLASAEARLLGEAKSDRAGYAVAGGVDVNSDGFDDLLVAANGNDSAGSNAGRIYLMYGPVSGELDLAAADARLDGVDANDVAGSALAGVGDVDGDGYEDFLIGAYAMSYDGVDPGGAYLVRGPVSGDMSLADAEATFVGEADADRAGWSVAGAGDLDDDGLDDLLIGAYAADPGGLSSAGAIYVVRGPIAGIVPLINADARIVGEATNDYTGVSVTAAGDVDGDGTQDVLVGGHGEDDGGSKAGAGWVLSGPFEGELTMAEAAVKITGLAAGDYLGWSVASGDMDGNGTRDLLLGAYTASDAAGGAYLLLNYGL